MGEREIPGVRFEAIIQRTDMKPETLGLTLAEGKMILKDLQQIVVGSQM